MEDERMEQNRQPEKTDVVFFSPEMLRLADQHRREIGRASCRERV